MSEPIRDRFTFTLPKKVVARIDLERGLITRSAYVTSILAKVYNMNMKDMPYPGRKIGVQGPDMTAREVVGATSLPTQQ